MRSQELDLILRKRRKAIRKMDDDIISKEMATKIINSTFNMLMPEDVGKVPLG